MEVRYFNTSISQNSNMADRLAKIYQCPKTVLTTRDLALLWTETDQDKLKSAIYYYVKTGKLLRLSRGIFAKNKNYDPKDLAASIYAPSYISFETVLREAGVIFQYYETIFLAGARSKDLQIDNNKFTFRKLKNIILFSTLGIVEKGTYWQASTERAFLDMLYLFPRYGFDNLRPINWEKCFELAPLYKNKQLIKRLKQYQKEYA